MRHFKQILKYYMYTMFILMGMTSCHWFEEEEKTLYDRTVLVYMAADNSLSQTYHNTPKSFLEQDISEMISAANDIPSNCRLILYVDDKDLPRILTIEQQQGRRPVCKTLHQYKEEHNSGDTETLRLAMEWMMENSPSESYGLVLWSHGNAWVPAKAPAQKIVCQDYQSGSWMEIPEIAETLSSFPRLEFILFDACFMQSIEVAYELRHVTRHIIASPAEIPAPGAPYNRITSAMFAYNTYAERIAEEYYLEYLEGNILIPEKNGLTYGVCLSVIDCNELDYFATVTKQMITKYATSQSNINLSGVQRYFLRNTPTCPAYYDMNGYMQRLITDPNDYTQWYDILNRVVTHKRATEHWFSDYTGEEDIDADIYSGVSCYVPKTQYADLNRKFRSTSWYTAAGWQQIGW